MLPSRDSWTPYKFILINLCPICYCLDQIEMDDISEAGTLLLTFPDGIFNTWKYQRSKFKGRCIKSLSLFQEMYNMYLMFLKVLDWNHVVFIPIYCLGYDMFPQNTPLDFNFSSLFCMLFKSKSNEHLPFSESVLPFQSSDFFIIDFQRANQSH